MFNFISVVLLLFLFSLAGCYNPFKNPFKNPFSSGGDNRPSISPERVVEPTSKFSLAIGGVAPGRDELIITDGSGKARDFSGHDLACAAEKKIVLLRPRPGFDTQAAGSGVQIVATDSGVTAIRCMLDGETVGGVYEITIPPQNLIQILVAEASTQLTSEAKIEDVNGVSVVGLTSQSSTGNALGSVIRNRISRINAENDPALFAADKKAYDADPPASYYDAVIEASGQFSPVDVKDPTHPTFDHAQDRNFLDASLHVAYDQAVLTAAGIFNGDVTDTTGGAFAFYSPTAEEWLQVHSAWAMQSLLIPDGAGFTDANFPTLAPIQIFIHPGVWKYPDGRPSFVFARGRSSSDAAVVNTP